MNTKCLVQLCCMLLAAGNSLAAPELKGLAEMQAATTRLLAKNTLNFSDPCSYEDENRRFAIGVKLLDMAYESNYNQMHSIALEMDQVARSSNGNFCNSIKNLQCTSAGICGCAVGEVMGMSVRSIREDGACRLSAGSDCAPASSRGTSGTEESSFICQAGSECIHIKDKSPCTEAGVQNELIDSYGGTHMVQNDPKGFLGHAKNKLAEGICICSGEPSIQVQPTIRDVIQNSSTQMTTMTSLIIALFGLVILRFGQSGY